MNVTSMPFARLASALALTAMITSSAFAEHASAPQPPKPAKVMQYLAPDGTGYFAVAIQGDFVATAPDATDHVVLFDTSASQAGVYRGQALRVLKAFLASLRANDRVSLFAVDVRATRLTDGFVPVRGDSLAKAISQLEQRTPLGATDLAAAVTTALGELGRKQHGSILYIGDGMSAADLIGTEQIEALVDELRQKHIPVHSYAVGPRTDLPLLGLLAQFSGGVVAFDHNDTGPGTVPTERTNGIGRELAAASARPVFYPTTVEMDLEGVELYPQKALPVRTDRATIYLAKGHLADGTSLDVRGILDGRNVTFRWSVAESFAEKRGSVLAALWKQAELYKGIHVPLAGMELLNAAQDAFDRSIDQMADAGRQALRSRRINQAETIGLTIRQLDPQNVDAKAILATTSRAQVQLASQATSLQPPDQPPPDQPPPDQPPAASNGSNANGSAGPGTTVGQDLIREIEDRQKIVTERMKLEVTRTIEEARAVAVDDPDAAVTLLKRAQGTVGATSDVDPEARAALRKRLRNVITDVRTQQEVDETKRIRQQERWAVIEADQRLQEQMRRDDQKLQQLIDRVRALIAEGRRGDDNAYAEAKEVARAAVDMQPGSGMTTAARVTSEAAYQVNNAFRWRSLRAERFLETLEQVEISHVPFPDEPPIRWPSAPVWKALSERRAKWASVDLHKSSPSEERIVAALDDQTELQFVDTPLQDVINYFAELHNLPIIIDDAALGEEGIAIDEPINAVLAGIKLRSALKIILEPLGLTYVIEDEVMKITTQSVAEEKLQTRVYPVGDLVIPIQSGAGLGGFGSLGGGLGGGGVGGGGLGGGLGGGGGGLGGGGGFFSVPPQDLKKK